MPHTTKGQVLVLGPSGHGEQPLQRHIEATLVLQKAAHVLPRLGAHWQVKRRRPSLGFPFPFPFPLPPFLLPKPSPFFLYPIIPITQQHESAAGRDAALVLWAGPST